MPEERIGEERNKYLFQHLVAMFQTLALQQLGKLMNPISGKLERDLQQARITIDMLEMIKVKTEGNLDDDERRLLDSVLVELQLNFVDESNREKEKETLEPPEKESANNEKEKDIDESGGGEEKEGIKESEKRKRKKEDGKSKG